MANVQNEIWKDIPHLQGCYQASNSGRIRSVTKYQHTGRIRKQHASKSGYLGVGFSINNYGFRRDVHRLILCTFSPNINEKNMQVNHIDGNKLNNNLSNLEWCTPSENIKHAIRIGTIKIIKGKNTKLLINLNTGVFYDSVTEAAICYGISPCRLSNMLSGRRYKNIFNFSYA